MKILFIKIIQKDSEANWFGYWWYEKQHFVDNVVVLQNHQTTAGLKSIEIQTQCIKSKLKPVRNEANEIHRQLPNDEIQSLLACHLLLLPTSHQPTKNGIEWLKIEKHNKSTTKYILSQHVHEQRIHQRLSIRWECQTQVCLVVVSHSFDSLLSVLLLLLLFLSEIINQCFFLFCLPIRFISWSPNVTESNPPLIARYILFQ